MMTLLAMTATRLLLIRHGETEWNIEGRLQGWQDSALSAHGVGQAMRLAESLAGSVAVALICSDAGRAVTTASAIGLRIAQTPVQDPRLREISFGHWEGHISAGMPADILAAKEGIMAMDPTCTQALPGGESPATVSARVWSCLDELAARYAGATVLIVSHGGVLASVLRTVLGIPPGAPRRYRIGNTAIVHLVRTGDGPWLLDFDDLDPLSPASRPA